MNLRALMIIDSKSGEKKYFDLLNKYNVKFKYIFYGKGTASSSLLEYFGINEVEKIIIIAILPKILSKHILRYIQSKFKINEPGGGIAFTMPLSSSTKYMQDFYENDSLEDFEMQEVNKHLIITITNEGYAETVMNSAKKAGASGGTTISGRGLETKKEIKFLGISIEPEKDVVMILVDEDKKTLIMDKIVESCGLKTPGAGICFSIPVDSAIGLIEDENLK